MGAEELELRALLLLLADRRSYETLAIERALVGAPSLRREAALTLGRIGDPRGRSPLAALMIDSEAEVRRAAAFALGQLGSSGDVQAASILLRAIGDTDRQTGALAVESLARLGVTLEDVIARLLEVPSEELFPRLLPALFRFEGPGVLGWAEQGLELDDPQLRSQAAYAVARVPQPEGLGPLRVLLADADPRIAAWAARGIGLVGQRDDLARLLPLLDRPEPGPVIQALRAARSLIGDGTAPPLDAFRPRILALLDDPRPGVRLTAIEAASAWLLDDALGTALATIASADAKVSGRARELALLSLAEADDPRALGLVSRAARDSLPALRARAAEAAALLEADPLLVDLADDPHPAVRQSALSMRLTRVIDGADALAATALEDPDAGVRAIALAWAEAHPELDVERLIAALERSRRDRILDARIAAAGALAARAKAMPAEATRAIETLAELAVTDSYVVRRAAIAALDALDQNQPPLGAVGGVTRPLQAYREIVERTAGPRLVDLETTAGTVRLRLDCPSAPLTCISFLQLANQGFYDGLLFHRVVPDFVVQAGDPGGDGRGGPGYSIRDEMTLLRYDRGVLGMALSGADTAGSQFFITTAPQPHLDGSYPAFGQVVAGADVLDRIVQGDGIVRIREVEGE